MNLYKQQLMDHYRHPRNRGTLSSPDFKSGQYNPSCGDTVSIEGVLRNNIVEKIAFQGSGCVISQATASLLTQSVLGTSIEHICSLDKDSVLAMIGIELGPVRLKCALLPLEALQKGIALYKTKDGSD